MLFSHRVIKMAWAHRAQPPFHREGALAHKALEEGGDGHGMKQKYCGYDGHGDGNVAKKTEVTPHGVKGVKALKDDGVEESFGIGNVAKETEGEVKRHGVKGVIATKDDGVEESFGIGNVAKETEDEVKRHVVKGVKALKDDGVEESFGIGNIAKETKDEVKRHGVKGVKALKDDGVEESFGIGNVAKETEDEVNRHGVKGVNALKDDVIEESFGIRNVAKETNDEAKRHGVKGVKALKDDGVEESFGIGNVAKKMKDEVKCHGVKGVIATKDDGVEESFGIGNVAKETKGEVKRHGVKGVIATKDDGVEESFVKSHGVKGVNCKLKDVATKYFVKIGDKLGTYPKEYGKIGGKLVCCSYENEADAMLLSNDIIMKECGGCKSVTVGTNGIITCKLKNVATEDFSKIRDKLGSYLKKERKNGGKLGSYENEANVMLLSNDDMMKECGSCKSNNLTLNVFAKNMSTQLVFFLYGEILEAILEEKRSKVSTGADARMPSCRLPSVNDFLSCLGDYLSRALGVFLFLASLSLAHLHDANVETLMLMPNRKKKHRHIRREYHDLFSRIQVLMMVGLANFQAGAASEKSLFNQLSLNGILQPGSTIDPAEAIVNSFDEFKDKLERCGCNCSFESATVDLTNISSFDFTTTVTIKSACKNATIRGRSNTFNLDSSPLTPRPILNMTAGKIFVDGLAGSVTSLNIDRVHFKIAPEVRASIVNWDADLDAYQCLFETNGVSSAIEASGTGAANVNIESCLFVPQQNNLSTVCPNFNFTHPVKSCSVFGSTFIGDLDQDSCFEGVSYISAARNRLIMRSYYDTARMIEKCVCNVPTLLDIDGAIVHVQFDAFNGTKEHIINLGSDVNITIELDLSYGDQKDLDVTSVSKDLSLTKLVPDFIQVTSKKSPACVESIRVIQGADIVVDIRARVFENCSSVCNLSTTPSSCWPKIFTYDSDQKCLLISPDRSIDITIDLDKFYCSRLIPPLDFPYKLRIEAMNTTHNLTEVSIDESLFENATPVLLSGSGSQFAAKLSNKLPPKNLKITAPGTSGGFCVSRVFLERDDDTNWVDVTLANVDVCLQDSCDRVYNVEEKCLHLSNEFGAYEALTIDFSKQGCEKFRFTRAGGPNATSICHKTLSVNSTEEIQEAISRLNENIYSSLLLNVFDLVHNKTMHPVVLKANRSLEMEYVGDPSGNRKLLSTTSRLFYVGQGAYFVLSGFIIEKGGIDNDGGIVQLVDLMFVNAYSGLTGVFSSIASADGGTLINRNNGMLEVVLSTFSGSRSRGNGGTIATIEGSVTSIVRSNLKNSSASGVGQILFNCKTCRTQIDGAIFDGSNIIFNEEGGQISIAGRMRMIQETSFFDPGSSHDIIFEDVSRLAQVFPPQEWCTGNLTAQVFENITFKNCEENCLSNGTCQAVAYTKNNSGADVGDCSLCTKRPCGFSCTNATLFFEPKELFKFAVVDFGANGICLKNVHEIVVTFPIQADTVRKCQEACGFFDKCKFAQFRDADSSCKLYSSATFTATSTAQTICGGRVYFKYSGFSTLAYTMVTSNGCFQNKGLLGNITLTTEDIDQKCEAVCLSNPFCRAFQTLFDRCKIYDGMWFEDECMGGGKIFIDVGSQSFPTKDYVSFSNDIKKSEGSASSLTNNSIVSIDACQRYCDKIAGCIAIVFFEKELECITFSKDQLSDGIFEGGVSANIFVALHETDVSKLDSSTFAGCPTIKDFSSLQPSGFAGTFSEQNCATVCYYSNDCNVFLFNLTSQMCKFFTTDASPQCTSNRQNVSWSSVDERAWEVRRRIERGEDYYEMKEKCVLQQQLGVFELNVSLPSTPEPTFKPTLKPTTSKPTTLEPTALTSTTRRPTNKPATLQPATLRPMTSKPTDTELLCKELCSSFKKCIALIFDQSTPDNSSCKLLSQIVVLGKINNGTCADGRPLNKVHISLEKVNSKGSFLPVPDGHCPLSRIVNVVKKPTSKPTSKKPTSKPNNPTSKPTTNKPTRPTFKPTSKPTSRPTSKPTSKPTSRPTSKPTSRPTSKPTSKPTSRPTSKPTSKPTSRPTSTTKPTSIKPTSRWMWPTWKPTSMKPTSKKPTSKPTYKKPTSKPTSKKPTSKPTSKKPTSMPTSKPRQCRPFPTRYGIVQTKPNITQSIIKLDAGNEQDCERLCVQSPCQAYTWEDPDCILETRPTFDDCSNLDLNFFQIMYFRPEFTGLSDPPKINVSETALELAVNLTDNLSCQGLCKIFSDCGGVIYNQTTKECAVLSGCESSFSNGLDPLTCLKAIPSYSFFKVNGFCLNETEVSCKKIVEVFRLDHCMAYCDGWYGCSMFIYNQKTLTCELYQHSTESRPSLVATSQAASCLVGGVLYLSSEYSPLVPFQTLSNATTGELCLSDPPRVSRIANSPEACFKYYCEPRDGCSAFTYDKEVGSCILYSSYDLTNNCTSSNSTNSTTFLRTEFDAKETANISANNIGQISLSREIECAILCETSPPCNGYMFLPDTEICQLVDSSTNSSFGSANSTGKSVTPLGKQTRLIRVDAGRQLLEENRIISFSSAEEWFCLWLCDITAECSALEYNSVKHECDLFDSGESVQNPASMDSLAVWVVYQNATTFRNRGNDLAGKPLQDARNELKCLNEKINLLEMKARPLFDNLGKVGSLTTSAVEILETVTSPLINLEDDIDAVLQVVEPIVPILQILEQSPVKPIKALIKATKIDSALKKLQQGLKRAEKVVNRAGTGVGSIQAPFDAIDNAVIVILDILDIFSPPDFLRVFASLLKTLIECVEKVSMIGIRDLMTEAVKVLCKGVIELIAIIDTLGGLIDEIAKTVRDLESKLKGEFKAALSLFAGVIIPIRKLFMDTFPFNQLSKLLDQTIIKLPEISFGQKTFTLDFGVLGKKDITLPTISIGGEFCLPFANGILCDIMKGGIDFIANALETVGKVALDIGCGVATVFTLGFWKCEPPKIEINVEGIINTVLGGVLKELTGSNIGPRIDLKECLACIRFSDEQGTTLTVRTLIDYVGRAIDAVSKLPIIGFLLDLLDKLIVTALEVTGINKWFPEFPLDIPDLVDFDELIDVEFLTKSKEKIDAIGKSITDTPAELFRKIFEPLQDVLDSIPCNELGKLIFGEIGNATAGFGGNTTTGIDGSRRMQKSAEYSKFESITFFRNAVKSAAAKGVQFALGNQRRKVLTKNQQKQNSAPKVYFLEGDYLVDPRYLLREGESNDQQGDTNEYGRVAYGAIVMIFPPPSRINKNSNEEKEFLLFSYLVADKTKGEIKNEMICVNKISSSGLVEDYVFRKAYEAQDLRTMLISGFSSDRVFDTRIDFPGPKDAGKFTSVNIDKLVLEVVDKSKVKNGKINTRKCIGCMKGAGCIKDVKKTGDIADSLETSTIRVSTEKEVGRPQNTRSFLALYAGEMSRDIFYDKNTFGFFLTTRNGVGGKSNSNSGGCALFLEGTTPFREHWLPQGEYTPDRVEIGSYVPESLREVRCTNSFTMLSNGAVHRSNNFDDPPAGGTFWANQVNNVNVDLFGCDNANNFLSNQNFKLQDSGVEHIIEKSIMKGTPVAPYPLVDFVMAWQYWNGENGDFRKNAADNAENEKKRLYGEDVYNCIEKLLGGILLQNPDQQPQDSCQENVWSSQECESALSDVGNRIIRSNVMDLIGV